MDTTVIRIRNITTAYFPLIVYTLSFSIPFLFSSSQIIVGALINCLLFLSAKRLPTVGLLTVCVLPSLGAVAHGVLFGPQTIFIYYFLPFIWISNYILVFTFQMLVTKHISFQILLSAVAKFAVLQLIAQLYVRYNVVPAVFLTSMGYIQLITAISGGLLAYGILISTSYDRHTNTH